MPGETAPSSSPAPGPDPDGPPAAATFTHSFHAHANRIRPIIDAADYFAAARQSMIAARRRITIVGWEMHSEIDLLRGEHRKHALDNEPWPVRLADLLLKLAEQRPQLEILLLIWEGSALFALERQFVPRMKRPWANHPRVRLVWDRDTPPLGAQHQKLLCIDDKLAYVGGIDITQSRWDTHKHHHRDQRRIKPGLFARATGAIANPYHDAMLAVDGDAAKRLAQWTEERWRRATGESLQELEHQPDDQDHPDPWPEQLPPRFHDRTVYFALTQPHVPDDPDTKSTPREELRHNEQSYIEQIESAQHLIYIHTQYLAAASVADALAKRLEQSDAPEIILVLPWGAPSKLQSLAMDHRRDELLDQLREADASRNDGKTRFAVYWARVAESPDNDDIFQRSVYIHAKTMVIDDNLLRIGSANLNGRSMGLDAELDAWFTAQGNTDDTKAIRAYRHHLTAYLLGTTPDKLAETEQHQLGAIAAIESLRAGERTLVPLTHRAKAKPADTPIDLDIADPDRPPSKEDAERAIASIKNTLQKRTRLRTRWNALVGSLRRHRNQLIILAALAIIAAAWAFTPLRTIIDTQTVTTSIANAASSPLGLIAAAAIFTALATAGAPVTVLIAAVGASLGIGPALAVNYAGVTLAAAAGFIIGKRFPGKLEELLGKGRLRSVGERLKRRGIATVAILRNLPVAPFGVVNIACGVTGLKFWPYLIGSVIGMTPGIILITIFGAEFADVIQNPSPTNVLTLAAAVAAVVITALTLDRLLSRFAPTNNSDQPPNQDNAGA